MSIILRLGRRIDCWGAIWLHWEGECYVISVVLSSVFLFFSFFWLIYFILSVHTILCHVFISYFVWHDSLFYRVGNIFTLFLNLFICCSTFTFHLRWRWEWDFLLRYFMAWISAMRLLLYGLTLWEIATAWNNKYYCVD